MKWLLDLLGINVTQSRDELAEAIEHVVEGIEPRLRLVPGYQRKLLPALKKALNHIDQTVERIHGPLVLDRKNYIHVPEVNALFASADELDSMFLNSGDISNFLCQPRAVQLDEAWALLCVCKKEKAILGMELDGDKVRRDVPQTTVNFYDHKLMAPAADVDTVRSGIKKCIFDALITHGLQHIVRLKSQRRELEDQYRILHARLRARQAAGNGLSSLLASADAASQPPLEDVADELQEMEAKLQQLPPSQAVLDVYLDEIRQIFDSPEAFIQVEEPCYRLNQMGVKVENNSLASAYTVCFSELQIAKVLRRVVALVQFRRECPAKAGVASHSGSYLHV